MNKILILKGLPASGKSTWTKELMKKEPGKWKRFNKDDLRLAFDDGEWSHENENYINSIIENCIKYTLKKNINIVYDNTSFSSRIYARICEIAKNQGDILVEEKIFEVSLEICIERDSLREGRAKVGEKVIRDMYDRYKLKYGYPKPKSEYFPAKKTMQDAPKKEYKEFVKDETKISAIICDLDGTLAKIGDRSPFDASKCDELDCPNIPVVETVKALYKQGYAVIFVSGRENKYELPTRNFIAKCLPDMPYELFMRKTKDFRGDDIVKEEIYINEIMDRWQILLTLDDRLKVVSAWRNNMQLTCFQVAEGDF